MNGKKNPAIVCCRTASMILIVLCHIIGYYSFIPGHHFLPLVFNVGVHSFLLISGYLYGGKRLLLGSRGFISAGRRLRCLRFA